MLECPTCYRCKTQPCKCQDGVTLYHVHVMDGLRAIASDSVHCAVTSPPYFALRSYLPAGDPLKPYEIGSEPTPEAFIATMVEVFREVRRVLRPDGVCFVNLGDSYSSDTKWGGMSSGKHNHAGMAVPRPKRYDGAPLGNLLNIPHQVAEALRQDGWIWRQTIVVAKRSPMPESVGGWRWVRHRVKVAASTRGRNKHAGGNGQKPHGDRNGPAFDSRADWADCPGCVKCESHGGFVLRRGAGRCTTAHEYLFVLTKTNRYFWDGEASKEKALEASIKRQRQGFKWTGREEANHYREGFGRNPRSVWTLSTEPTKVRHFATFPSELVRRCLVAGVSAGGCCPSCGAPWAPVVESERVATRPALNPKAGADWKHNGFDRSATSPNLDPERHLAVTKCLGYRPTCDCGRDDTVGALVLDPFNGIGTTGQTAHKLGCRYIGIDLNAAYLDVSATRIFEPPRWWLRQQTTKRRRPTPKAQRGLF